VLYYSISDI